MSKIPDPGKEALRREAYNAYHRRYYAANRERLQAYNRQYHKDYYSKYGRAAKKGGADDAES